MYVKIEWHENKYMHRGGYWHLKLMYSNERDSSYKYGFETDTAQTAWGAEIKARRMMRKAKRMQKKGPQKREWIVEQ